MDNNKESKNSCMAYFEKIKNVAKFKMKLKETMNLLNNNLNNNNNKYLINTETNIEQDIFALDKNHLSVIIIFLI